MRMSVRHDTHVLPTLNEEWGFFGTLRQARWTAKEARRAWNRQSSIMIRRYGLSPDHARAYLDSTNGRHLADALVSKVAQGVRAANSAAPGWLAGNVREWRRRYRELT